MIQNKSIIKKIFDKKNWVLFMFGLTMLFMAFIIASANALSDTTQPTILSVTPANTEQDLSRNVLINVVFSEDIDPLTINTNTFAVMQRTTPEYGGYESLPIDGVITYSNRVATFTADEKFVPNQRYGNVFTAMITNEVTDVAGNALSNDYVWSFTTGEDPYNTGASTSQTNQTATNENLTYDNNLSYNNLTSENQNLTYENATSISGLALTPVAGQPPIADVSSTDAPATVANIPIWTWIIGGIVLLLLFALIFTLVTRAISSTSSSTSKTISKKTVQTSNRNPVGEVHSVNEIEGIGPEYKKGLNRIGIRNTAQLWRADTAKIARETGAPLSTVMSWQNMAELSSVKDIGPQYAELLERSGVHNIAQLKSYDPDELLKLVRKKQDSLKINIQGNSPGHATVEHWISEAQNHTFNSYEGETA